MRHQMVNWWYITVERFKATYDIVIYMANWNLSIPEHNESTIKFKAEQILQPSRDVIHKLWQQFPFCMQLPTKSAGFQWVSSIIESMKGTDEH